MVVVRAASILCAGADGLGDHDFAALGVAADATGEVDLHAVDLAASLEDFGGVDTNTQLQSAFFAVINRSIRS